MTWDKVTGFTARIPDARTTEEEGILKTYKSIDVKLTNITIKPLEPSMRVEER